MEIDSYKQDSLYCIVLLLLLLLFYCGAIRFRYPLVIYFPTYYTYNLPSNL